MYDFDDIQLSEPVRNGKVARLKEHSLDTIREITIEFFQKLHTGFASDAEARGVVYEKPLDLGAIVNGKPLIEYMIESYNFKATAGFVDQYTRDGHDIGLHLGEKGSLFKALEKNHTDARQKLDLYCWKLWKNNKLKADAVDMRHLSAFQNIEQLDNCLNDRKRWEGHDDHWCWLVGQLPIPLQQPHAHRLIDFALREDISPKPFASWQSRIVNSPMPPSSRSAA